MELSKERLEELRDYFVEFQSIYSDPADKYNYEVFRDAGEIASGLLSAEEQQPVAWMVTDIDTGERIIRSDRSYFEGPNQPLYATPQLPQQGKEMQVPECFIKFHKIIEARHHGRMPEEVQQAFDECAAMLSNEPVSNCDELNSPAIPDGLIAAVNRLLDSDGSRGCYSATRCHEAREEIERLLAAAPKLEVKS
ncbi:MAG: hypothetical protein E7B59_12525 [Enterobacteriaceae bacterium]|nr:hypothetical protein [Enterobacteriaceae bacterium]